MFFGLMRRHKLTGGASHSIDPAGNEAAYWQSRQWHTWRRSEQKVTRAWNEWLAADGRERPELYRCYISALAEEEQAARELEGTVKLGANAETEAMASTPPLTLAMPPAMPIPGDPKASS